MPDSFRLDDRIALVTGSTRGLGLAIARAFAAHGAQVVVSSESARDTAGCAATLQAEGLPVVGIPCDVSRPGEQHSLVEKSLHAFGGIDVLVCNAGITGTPGPFATLDLADYDRVMTVNLRSMVELSQLTLPHLAARKQGSLILLSSIAGLRGNGAINAYALAKAGVAQLARNLAVEWGPRGVRVNAISPGLIRTDLAAPLLENQEFMARRLQMTPLRRVGEPDEVANAAVFLASRAGAFVTGQNLVVDGGTTITDGS